MINAIYREIVRCGILHIGVMLFLVNNKTAADYQKYKPRKAFRRFIGRNGVSLTYDFPTFIVLDYSMATGTFVKENKMFLPIQQVVKIIEFVKKTIRVVEDPDGKIYYWDADHNNQLAMYHLSADDMNKLIVSEYGLSGNHVLQSYPTIVKDYQDNLYEGAVIRFDRTENSVMLSYDELRALHYVLAKTDFITLSQAMLNSTKLWTDKGITKHLDIDTNKATDAMQRNDLNRSIEVQNQPATNMPVNVFGELKVMKGEIKS